MEESPRMVVPIFDLVLCLAQAVDLISPLVANHHTRTAQIAYSLGTQMAFSQEELRDLVIAAALHDVGGLTQQDRLDTLEFEYQNPYGHSVSGYLLLRSFSPFLNAAEMVRFHHVPWKNGEGAVFDGQVVPRGSHLLQLADRVAVLIAPGQEILEQVEEIMRRISAQVGGRFVPEQVLALQAQARKESFWLDAIYMHQLASLSRRLQWQKLEITQDHFLGLTNLFRRIIDFRSQFTSTHSAGVAATAEKLAELAHFSKADCWLMHLAGLLHDLGKLAVPAEILEKKGRLTHKEFDIIRRHTYYTFHLLEPLEFMDIVRIWGALHHERLDGNGYPFHLDEADQPLGSRIISIADIFTALSETRPYRKGMSLPLVLRILTDAAAKHRVDPEVVALLRDHLEEVDEVRRAAQIAATVEYRQFIETSERLTHKD